MCEMLGISSNQPASWREVLAPFKKRGGDNADNPDGWGLAYRDSDNWQLEKRPEAAFQSDYFTALSNAVFTDLLIAHVRKANPPSPYTLNNTHPFLRDCCGRQWVFAHNGKVPEVTLPNGCCHPERSIPKGETDSEHAFYYLLDEIAGTFNDVVTESNTPWLQTLAQLSESIAAYGQFNFLMSDGRYLIAYGHDRLYTLRRHHDGRHSALLASEPLTDDEPWKALRAGELHVYQDGQLLGSLQTTPKAVCKIESQDNCTPPETTEE